MNKFQTLIVDISHLMYRNASVAGKDLYTKDNLPVKALYGILTSINKVLENNPRINKIYLAFDGYPKWRKDLYSDYKGNRASNPDSPAYKSYVAPDSHGWSKKDSLDWTIKKVKEIAQDFAMHIIYNEISEADDMAFQLGKELYDDDDSLIFMSDDKDWLQLINLFPKSTVFRAMAGEVININNFQSTQGIPANWFIIQKIFNGDNSDNIHQVIEGCGEKAIEFLITEAIKRNIDPENDNLYEELISLVKELEINNSLGRYKNLVKISGEIEQKRFKLNQQLVDFRNCPTPKILTEKINVRLNLNFEKSMSIMRMLEFKSLTKIILPGSPWYRLQ